MEIYNGDKWWEIDSTSPEEQTGGTRALLMGGATPSGTINTIEFANIDTTGNFADFGDLTAARNEGNPVRVALVQYLLVELYHLVIEMIFISLL